jgi:hypothetical protein
MLDAIISPLHIKYPIRSTIYKLCMYVYCGLDMKYMKYMFLRMDPRKNQKTHIYFYSSGNFQYCNCLSKLKHISIPKRFHINLYIKYNPREVSYPNSRTIHILYYYVYIKRVSSVKNVFSFI